jgi:hypothetical protein
MPGTSIHELAISEIERLSRRGFQQLALPEPLESGFEQSTFVQRAARLWIEGLIAIGFFNIYVIADYFIRGGVSWFPLQVRLCIGKLVEVAGSPALPEPGSCEYCVV